MLETLKNALRIAAGLDDPKKMIPQGKCVACGLDAAPRCYSDLGRREFQISGMCEVCYDSVMDQEEG